MQKIVLTVLAITLGLSAANAKNIYVAQTAAGTNSGADCQDAHAATWFNTAANWGSGATQISPGDTVHLCGVFTGTPGQTMLTIQGSGAAGNPITILFEPGAKLTSTYWGANGAINRTGREYIIIDGGTTCGNVNGSVVPCNGKIEATANGTGLANYTSSNGIVCGTGSGSSTSTDCRNVEIRNLEISNMFQRQQSDSSTACDAAAWQTCGEGLQNWGDISGNHFHNLVIHDAGDCINVNYPPSSNMTNIEIDHNVLSRCSHMVNYLFYSPTAASTTSGLLIHDNDISDMYPWLDPNDYFHGDGVMVSCSTGGQTISGFQFYNNYFHGNFNPGSHVTAFLFLSTDAPCHINGTYFNNLAITNANSSPSNGIIHCQGGCTNSRFYNNTFTQPAGGPGYGVRFATYSGANSIVDFRNNVISGFDYYLETDNITSASADNNIYYGGSTMFKLGSSTYNFSGWQGTGRDTHGMSANPNLGTTGFPNSGSPAINLGANLTGLGIAALDVDKIGLSRPSSGSWDAGCYDFGSSASLPPPAPAGLTALVQ